MPLAYPFFKLEINKGLLSIEHVLTILGYKRKLDYMHNCT